MKILFISRAYPPVTGGIENQNYALSVWLKKFAETDTIANHYGKKALPLFFPYATVRTLFALRHYDVLLLGDGVLGLLGFIVKCFYPKKTVVSIVHGLDLTYQNSFYQRFWLGRFLPALDGLIAVSRETHDRAVEKNIPAHKVVVIPNGVETETFARNYSRSDLEKVLGENIQDKVVLLTAGRLVKRKGAEWFIRNVLGQLGEDTLYVLAGSGPEEENIRKAIAETHLENRVRLLGRVTDEARNILLHTTDIFVQPNIKVPGDMEGFGIAVIEATASGCPVVASNIEGLKDAICQNENGILVTSEDSTAFKNALVSLINNREERLALGKRALHYTETHYHWNVIARLYVSVLEGFKK